MLTKMTSRRIGIATTAAALLLTALGWAAPVLHEYFDVAGGAPPEHSASRTPGTNAPTVPVGKHDTQPLAATRGESDSNAGDGTSDQASEGTSDANPSQEDHYRLDSNTSRPNQVSYSDPFVPAIPPFKRLYAYDAVDEKLDLIVANRELHEIAIGGHVAAGDDQFFGDLEVEGSSDGVRLPSVGPDARVLSLVLDPPASARVRADGADNRFLELQAPGPHHLTMHLAIDREVFGSSFNPATWDDLQSSLPARPALLFDAAAPVLAKIGVSREQMPAQVTARLVEYFREFVPSDDPIEERGAALYQRIALSQRGVCRHRAFAFVVSALALGLPSRFVHNEAHAWVEVYDAKIWHRIDLGGAASHVGIDQPLELAHVAPPDPFPWPPNSERGADMFGDKGGGNPGKGPLAQSMSAAPSASTASSDPPAASAPSALPEPPGSAPEPGQTAQPDAPPSNPGQPQPDEPASASLASVPVPALPILVNFSTTSADVNRGGRVGITGRVQQDRSACAFVRLDVVLEDGSGARPVGVLMSDERGQFTGEISIADSVPVGDYQLDVVPAEGASCSNSGTGRLGTH
jgi:hypothetical protein